MLPRDLTDQRFGRWLVVCHTGYKQRSDYRENLWCCICDCGVKRILSSRILLHKTRNSRSCGCARSDAQRLNPSRRTHGLSSNHRLYHVWKTMRQRCSNPKSKKYPRYGGRGIRVCERWDDFSLFIDDVGDSYREGLTLDRINNDGDYEPCNVRWSDVVTQANNRYGKLIIDTDGYTLEQLINWHTVPKLRSYLETIYKTPLSPECLSFTTLLGTTSAMFNFDSEVLYATVS